MDSTRLQNEIRELRRRLEILEGMPTGTITHTCEPNVPKHETFTDCISSDGKDILTYIDLQQIDEARENGNNPR